MCVLQEGVCVWAPEESRSWPGLPDTGGRAHWAVILKHLTCAYSNTHKQRDQTDTLLTSGSLFVNRCFLPSRPNHTASAPQRDTVFPYRLTYRPGGRAAPPFGFSLVLIFVIVGSCSILTQARRWTRNEQCQPS